VANYNLEIAKYLCNVRYSAGGAAGVDDSTDFCLGDVSGQVLVKGQSLRYGENPHQQGAFYRRFSDAGGGWEQLGGKEMSYNNFLDFDAALRVIRAFPSNRPGIVIVKHLTPCGAAVDDSALQALRKAKRGDPRSHFGGIIASATAVDRELAEEITKDFVEIVIAPAFDEDALALLGKKSNLRLIRADYSRRQRYETRSVEGGMLIQETDGAVSSVREMKVMSERGPSASELADLQFAWILCAYVKSNAITFVKDNMLLAGGGGQTSRIDATEVAVAKSRMHEHNLTGAVAASDAFFPFPDCLELMAQQGIVAVAAPSGAKHDKEIVAAADRLKMTLLFAAERHFRH
jgi:phosphoribosylaminoimidazolecarboxamide formyltransferase / IMP cyclohydrolase